MAPPGDPAARYSPTRLINLLRREPLIHFLLLAGLLFMARALLPDDTREAITIDRTTQEFLVQQATDLRLRPPTEAEKRDAIATFVDEEILFREARKRGFDSSPRVRRLLVQNMRFFLAQEVPEPTEAELHAYFDSNRERFTLPATLALDHRVFADPEGVPTDALQRLRDGAGIGELGDQTTEAERRLYDLTRRRLASHFGPEGANRIMAIAGDDWVGPITSPRGVHFVRVAQRTPATAVSFEEARHWLVGDWQLAQQRALVEEALTEMRSNYRVELVPAAESAVE